LTDLSNCSHRSVVSIQAVEGDVRRAVRACLEAAEWTRVIPAGAPVALKVNLGWDLFIPGSITSPLVAEALIHEIRGHVGSISMIEADQVLEDIEGAFRKSGMAEVCRRNKVQWVNLSRQPVEWLDFPENRVLKKIAFPRILRESLLVTVPVMKTHAKTMITGALKNQWGCLPTMRHEYHLDLDDALADLNAAMRPALSVMDATVGLEGNGPKSGSPRITDRILCSTDPVALDTLQAISMGFDPGEIRHLSTCAAREIGTNDLRCIDVRGLAVDAQPVPYRPAHHNAVSSVENLLRRSTLKRLFFNTPIFGVCLFGAKLYYHLWSAMNARECWRPVLLHPLYGPQWAPNWKGLEPR
jgi:uncharacterized protein (DUF362 family)